MSLNDLTEPRAKRTHARRSCEVCKVRKTRCELPDLEVPSSPHPLPLDKSCHRCRVLTIPCVVDDSNKKARKRPRTDGQSASGMDDTLSGLASATTATARTAAPRTSSPSSRRRSKAAATASAARPSATDSVGRNGLNHTLDVLHGIQPAIEWADAQGWAGAAHHTHNPPHDPFAVPIAYEPPEESMRTKSMKLHCRPLELVCAMLKVAYGKTQMRGGRKAVDDLSLEYLIDADLRHRLDKGFLQLKVLHPYLDPLPALLEYTRSEDLGHQLLIAVIVYLCTIVLPTTADISMFRAMFSEHVLRLRDRALLSLPSSFQAIQAFELLSMHAPLGCLPLQATDLRGLATSKGQLAAMSSISRQLGLANLVKTLATGPGIWELSEPWLYFSVSIQEASASLGDEVSKRPATLPECQQLLDPVYDESNDELWRTAGDLLGAEGVLGRLAICDRVSRLSIVFDSLERLRASLEMAAADPNYDVVEALREELQYFTQRMADTDQKHDRCLDLISRTTRGLESGWTAYRGFRRRYETCKVYAIGLRYTMAISYLPGHPLAFPDLNNNLNSPLSRINYAIERACTPADIIPFLMQNNPAVHSVWYWGGQRGNLCQATLNAFVELEQLIVPGGAVNAVDSGSILSASSLQHVANSSGAADFVPLHEITCCVVDCAKILMEMQAGNIVVRRHAHALDRSYRHPDWLYTLKQVSAVLRALGTLPAEEEGLESFSNGCSNLIGSMVRMGEEWVKTIDSELAAMPPAPSDGAAGGGDGGAEDGATGKPFANGSNGAGNDGTHHAAIEPSLQAGMPDGYAHDPSGASGGNGGNAASHAGSQAGHQAYMDTSDRWMAAGGDGGPSGAAPGQGPPAEDGQSASYLANLIANTNSGGPGQQQQQQQQQQHHSHAQQFNHNPQEYPPTNLDLLLGQMFNYSGPQAAPPPSGQPQYHQPSAQQSQFTQQQQQQPQPPQGSEVAWDQVQ